MKNYLLVGSSSTISRHVAEKIHHRGHRVITISRGESSGISDEHHIADVCNDALPALDIALDGLVYFPGTINLKPFRSLKTEDFESDFKVNVLGAVRCMQHYLPALKKSGNASVVMFSTVAVQQGMPFHASVAVSKGAIEGLTRSMAAECAPEIRFNCIAPSLTDTTMAARLLNTPEKQASAAGRHPLKRYGKPEEMAAMVDFLLSDDAAWISGQILHIDGGMSTLRIG
jgi:3-oxoacyl-[acyl-carrier protein] reductase